MLYKFLQWLAIYKTWDKRCRIRILGHIPKTHFHVACSGGTDSIVLLDFLTRYPKNKFDVLYFNHGTKYCLDGEKTVVKYCQEHNIPVQIGRIHNPKKNGCSMEQYWRDERYKFLSLFKDEPILMAHTLDDCIETYVMSCMQGIQRLIPYHNSKFNVYRPFLTVSKRDIYAWIRNHRLKYSLDCSNYDTSIPRNFVRHRMMKLVRFLNPGIEKTIYKKIIADYKKEYNNGKRTH